jgi:hypothetical protein
VIVILIQSCARLSALLAHGITAHLDAMCVVDQPVEDAVGQRRITYLFVPPRYRLLLHVLLTINPGRIYGQPIKSR